MLLDGAYPPDIRVQKEASSLVKAGFRVSVYAARKLNEVEEEYIEGVRVLRMNIPTVSDQFQKKGWHDIMGAFNFFYANIYREVLRIQDEEYSAVHVHDLPLAKTGLALSKKLNCHCVLDLHENYADGLEAWTRWQQNPLKKVKNALLFNQLRWSKYERRMVNLVDYVITSVDEMQARIIAEYSVPTKKTILIPNTEYRDFHKDQIVPEGLIEQFDGYFNICYIGGIGPHRGIDTAIKSMKYVLRDIPNARLNIIGGGSAGTMSVLRNIVRELYLEHAVIFLGQVPFDHVSAYMTHAHINIIPHNSNRQTNAVIPHKLFQSMLSNKPTLVSSCAPLKRTIESCNGGWVFEADNPTSCAQKIIEISSANSNEIARVTRARDCASGPLSWEATAEVLSSFYKEITK